MTQRALCPIRYYTLIRWERGKLFGNLFAGGQQSPRRSGEAKAQPIANRTLASIDTDELFIVCARSPMVLDHRFTSW